MSYFQAPHTSLMYSVMITGEVCQISYPISYPTIRKTSPNSSLFGKFERLESAQKRLFEDLKTALSVLSCHQIFFNVPNKIQGKKYDSITSQWRVLPKNQGISLKGLCCRLEEVLTCSLFL